VVADAEAQTSHLVVMNPDQRMALSHVVRDLVLGTQRFARQRLEALVHAEDHSAKKLPAVLFLCVHDAGRSQMALRGQPTSS